MKPGDTAHITHGPWTGHTGPVLAVFTGGWVTVRVANMERTFAAHEVRASGGPVDGSGQAWVSNGCVIRPVSKP